MSAIKTWRAVCKELRARGFEVRKRGDHWGVHTGDGKRVYTLSGSKVYGAIPGTIRDLKVAGIADLSKTAKEVRKELRLRRSNGVPVSDATPVLEPCSAQDPAPGHGPATSCQSAEGVTPMDLLIDLAAVCGMEPEELLLRALDKFAVNKWGVGYVRTESR